MTNHPKFTESHDSAARSVLLFALLMISMACMLTGSKVFGYICGIFSGLALGLLLWKRGMR